MVEVEYSEKTRLALDQQKEARYQNWRDIVFSCYGPTICELQLQNNANLDKICSQSFNKLQYTLIRDMFLHKPKDFHKYDVEKLGSNKFHIRMLSGEATYIQFEQYQLLDLMVVVLSNNNQNGMRFKQQIQKINGYEVITDIGIVPQGASSHFYLPSGGKEVFILRFVDGSKEYQPDFK